MTNKLTIPFFLGAIGLFLLSCGSASDDGYAIAVDVQGNAYITGRTFSDDFPTDENAYQPSPGGLRDAFAAIRAVHARRGHPVQRPGGRL